jgi:hypothetical protein
MLSKDQQAKDRQANPLLFNIRRAAPNPLSSPRDRRVITPELLAPAPQKFDQTPRKTVSVISILPRRKMPT